MKYAFILAALYLTSACNDTGKEEPEAQELPTETSVSQVIEPSTEVKFNLGTILISIPEGTFENTVTGEIKPASKTTEIVSGSETIQAFDLIFKTDTETLATPIRNYTVGKNIDESEINKLEDVFFLVINHENNEESIVPFKDLKVQDLFGSFLTVTRMSLSAATIYVCESPYLGKDN